jgi:glucose/arabinose dehydrogenase
MSRLSRPRHAGHAGLAALLALVIGTCGLALAPRGAPAAPGVIGREQLPPGLKVETFAGPLSGPVALAFLPDGRLLATEKQGALRIIADGILQPDPVIQLPTDPRAERGLIGVAVDPRFAITGWVYVFHTLVSPPVNRIVRFRLAGGRAVEARAVYTLPQSANIHNGGNLHFGPDGLLYVGIGEGGEPALSRDLRDPRGKILRLDSATTPLKAAAGNPYVGLPAHDPAIWAIGLRNPFDFTFDPISHALFATDNGPDCNDELNRVRPARDYGWRPDYACNRPAGAAGTEPPMWVWPDTIGVAGPAVYSGGMIPDWEGSLLVCSWNEGGFYRATLSRDRTRVEQINRVVDVTCHIDVTLGPDGAVYYLEGGGYSPGLIRRIVPDPDATPGPRPTLVPARRAFLPLLRRR